jgi:hypothetical protein
MEYLRGANLTNILKYRERVLPYLRIPENEVERVRQRQKWESNYQAAILDDRVHVLGVAGKNMTYDYSELASELEERYPKFAPWRFIKDESGNQKGGVPKILKEIDLPLFDENGVPAKAQFSAILVRKDDNFARVFFVDDTSRTVFGKLRVQGRGRDGYIEKFVSEVLHDVTAAYTAETAKVLKDGKNYPSLLTVFPIVKTLVESKIDKD